ncbi:MAG: hypothetical protein R2865_09640 [Deinococcales bacterium]
MYLSVTLQAEQGISGIGLYLFGLGLSDLLFQKLVGTVKTVNGFPEVSIPILSQIHHFPVQKFLTTIFGLWSFFNGSARLVFAQ